MSLSDTISEARQGVKLSQRCLYEKLYPFARMLCLRYLKFKEDAEEVMQDGFVKFFISLKDFRYESENAFYAYVRRIMVNECLARLRKNKVFELLPVSNIPDIAVNETVFEKADYQEICRVIQCLPVSYRTVFNLFAIDGFEHTEIAEVLNIKENVSRIRLLRARTMLQKMLTTKEIVL